MFAFNPTRPRILFGLIATSFCALIIFSIGMYLHKSGVNAKSNERTPQLSGTPATSQSDDTKLALLTRGTDKVQYKLPNASDFTLMNNNEAKIPSKTIVKTSENGSAHVIFPNNSVMSIDKDTEVEIVFEKESVKILQFIGNTWHRVEKVLQGHEYSVETPTTLATVRGTEFAVWVEKDKQTRVAVVESIVDVSSITKNSNDLIIHETQRVQKDQQINISNSSEPLHIEPLPPQLKQSEWFTRNTQTSQRIQELRKTSEKNNTSVDVNTKDLKEKEVINSALNTLPTVPLNTKQNRQKTKTEVKTERVSPQSPIQTDQNRENKNGEKKESNSEGKTTDFETKKEKQNDQPSTQQSEKKSETPNNPTSSNQNSQQEQKNEPKNEKSEVELKEQENKEEKDKKDKEKK